MLTYLCRCDIQVTTPNDRFLLVKFPDVSRKVFVPFVLCIESLKVKNWAVAIVPLVRILYLHVDTFMWLEASETPVCSDQCNTAA